jgi:hypothetical protein
MAKKKAKKAPVKKAKSRVKAVRKQLKTKTLPKKAARKAKSTRRTARPAPKAKAKARPKAKAKTKARPKAQARSKAKATPRPKTRSKASAPKPKAKAAPIKSPARKAARRAPANLPVPTRLLRERKRLPEAEFGEAFLGTGDDARLLQSARSGHDEVRSELSKDTESSLELTAGDVDARWQDAYAVGDEAPGGDSPTPDQDRVDDIGKALGVQYNDDEELMGGDEIAERDTHRWELDPASKDDDET